MSDLFLDLPTNLPALLWMKRWTWTCVTVGRSRSQKLLDSPSNPAFFSLPMFETPKGPPSQRPVLRMRMPTSPGRSRHHGRCGRESANIRPHLASWWLKCPDLWIQQTAPVLLVGESKWIPSHGFPPKPIHPLNAYQTDQARVDQWRKQEPSSKLRPLRPGCWNSGPGAVWQMDQAVQRLDDPGTKDF